LDHCKEKKRIILFGQTVSEKSVYIKKKKKWVCKCDHLKELAPFISEVGIEMQCFKESFTKVLFYDFQCIPKGNY
jgi:hypothetical protein